MRSLLNDKSHFPLQAGKQTEKFFEVLPLDGNENNP